MLYLSVGKRRLWDAIRSTDDGKGGGLAIRSVVVAGELGAFLEAAEKMGERLPRFMSAYQQFVRRYIHSKPLFSKFLGDQFVFVYESASPGFSRNVLHSAMVLEGAFREALKTPVPGFESFSEDGAVLETLNLGLSGGPLFSIDGARGNRGSLIGVPLLAARSLAEYAEDVRSHILVDSDLELDRVCSEWFKQDGNRAEEAGPVQDDDRIEAHIVTPDSVLREYRSDRERYHVVNAVEALKKEIDRDRKSDVFSFRLGRDPRPHIELVFNPLNVRGWVDRAVASSILLVHVTPTIMRLYPEILIPTDRVFTVQVPMASSSDYQIVIGLVIQAPEADLIGEELEKVCDPEEIVERLEALRRIFARARASDRLALAYYRF